MEKWIGYEEEGVLIRRGRETPNRIEGHELWDDEIQTLNMEIQVLAYINGLYIPIQSKYNQNDTYVLIKQRACMMASRADPMELKDND